MISAVFTDLYTSYWKGYFLTSKALFYARKVYFVFWSQKKLIVSNLFYYYFYTLLHYECKSNLSANGD